MKLNYTSLAVIGMATIGCAMSEAASMRMEPFGKTGAGAPISLYVLTNKNGMEAKITNFGGILVSLKTPDRAGKIADVVLGFDNLAGYEKKNPYFGAIVGRYGNRIAKGAFTLDGKQYTLPHNDGENTLHGGVHGFNSAVWTGQLTRIHGDPAVVLHYVSKDGEEGFPGNLSTTVTYVLNDANEVKILYMATTDKDTVLNLTNHSYFNLAGQGEGDILKHEVTIHASRYTPVDSGLIPTGELASVAHTPFDFTKATAIGARIDAKNEQLKLGKGYDHNFVLDGAAGVLKPAAEVYEPTSGRVLTVSTTEIGLQFYTGNFLDGTDQGKDGKVYKHRYAFCMETQHFPDSPNHPAFPATELKPGQTYKSETVFKLSAR